eukprot:snap_masked-scaffold_24-processed-gene-5.4-mRNA-1 protein AED:1.00 eAED:1.00 QI:0/0/0/0/1/1/2/0/62
MITENISSMTGLPQLFISNTLFDVPYSLPKNMIHVKIIPNPFFLLFFELQWWIMLILYHNKL